MVSGPGTLNFYWQVSSEAGYDFLKFYIDTALQDQISGDSSWVQETYSVGSGHHALIWFYAKDTNVSSGADCGWLDKVEFSEGTEPTTTQVPIDSTGSRTTPTINVNRVDYALVGVMYVDSPDSPPDASGSELPQEITVDLEELGLDYVENIYLATQTAWSFDLPNDVKVATLVCEYAEGGPPTTLDLIMGVNTAEWAYENPHHTAAGGPPPHSMPPVITSTPTTIDSDEEYNGHTYAASVSLDPTRTLSILRLELVDANQLLAYRSTLNPVPTWLGQANMAVTLEGRASATSTPVEVLILTNFDRMKDIGYDSASVDNLKTKLQDLADNNPNGRGVLVDLDTVASINTAYTNWDGNEGDIANTNALVQAIDNYIEDLKQNRYQKLKYVILVGSHEVLPMKARADDYTFGGGTSERAWSNKLPQKSGYLYAIYHAGINGHYLTDTIYGDLSYKDNSADHELTPELAVGRLVETPDQIIGVIDAYMGNKGKIPRNHYVSVASDDYLDGGTRAKNDMIGSGAPTDSSLVQYAYASTIVPPLLNAKHDVVYFAGHGTYNVISTGNDRFMAGSHSVRGDTSEINPIDGAVIVTSGCHNGVNFGNKK